MDVSQAVMARRSVRAFLDRPVDPQVLREVLDRAARAPSGGNLQPWRLYVVGGAAMAELKQRMVERLAREPDHDPIEIEAYPSPLGEPYRTCRYRVGEQLYALLGIERHDKAGRLRQFAKNFAFFGAPAAVFCYIDRQMGLAQWADLGMYLQTVMLLLTERGLDSCPQAAWSRFATTIADFLHPPAEWMLYSGLAVGYADPDAVVNGLVTERLPLDDFATFVGI
jgi:nitroreductase